MFYVEKFLKVEDVEQTHEMGDQTFRIEVLEAEQTREAELFAPVEKINRILGQHLKDNAYSILFEKVNSRSWLIYK